MTKKRGGTIKRYGSKGIKRCALDIKKKNVMRSNENEEVRNHNENTKKFDITVPIHMLVHIGY